MNVYIKCRFHSDHIYSHPAIIDAMQVTGSNYFATLLGYVMFGTELCMEDTKNKSYCFPKTLQHADLGHLLMCCVFL